ncbi:MAG TPA: helix-turn-helix domain-containing protein [bacterium]|nr:helix-turn-helix domain-containing protein [bacterium]HPR87365.1 helix-turn-helix domain-containing protein [bacterium]
MRFSGTNLINNTLVGVSPEIEAVRTQIIQLAKSKNNILVYGELGTEILPAARQIAAQAHLDAERICEVKGSLLEQKLQPWLTRLQEMNPAGGEAILIIDGLEMVNATAQQHLESLLTAPPAGLQLRVLATALPEINDAVHAQRFLPELFARLSAGSLRIPPLRERKEDVPLIFEAALQQIFGQMNRPIPAVPFDLVMHLVTHQWPGNLIELDKMAYELALQEAPQAANMAAAVQAAPVHEISSLSEAIEELEVSLIQQTLQQFGGSQRKTAQALGLTEPNLRYRMKKLGMNKKLVYSVG